MLLFEQAKTYIGAPGATTVPLATLQQTGEGSASNVVKLYKNNEDISILRVAWTTDGTTFSSAGLTNGGIVSDCVSSSGVPEVAGATQSGSCTSSYSGVNDPTTNVSPANLNQYATNEGTPGGSNGTDIGGVGGGRRRRNALGRLCRQHHHQSGRQLWHVPLGSVGSRR